MFRLKIINDLQPQQRWFRFNKMFARKCLMTGFLVLIFFTFLFHHQYFINTNESTNGSTNVTIRHAIRQCNPSKKVAFMKTHKCASSTVENIMFRHAYRQDLNVVIGKKGNYLSSVDLFNRSILSDLPWGKLDMDVFTLHNRWNFPEVVNLMGPSVRTFSIVRNPVDLFESSYSYYHLYKCYGVNLKGFVNILRENRTSEILQKRHGDKIGRNQLAWDMGFNPKHFDFPPESDEVKKKIAKLDKEFEMVMITERMDESLILLADLLCWPLEWVVHLDLNVRKPEKKADAGQHLNEEERLLLADFLRLDMEIYNHFNHRFEEHLIRFNSNFGHKTINEQLHLLNKENYKLKKQCAVKQVGNEKLTGKYQEPSNNDIMGYAINKTSSECGVFAWNERAYIEYFKQEMQKRAQKNLIN